MAAFAAVPGVTAHAGLAGAIVEGLVVVAVVGVLVAVWLRERRPGSASEAPPRLRSEDDR
jgi:hypothetical protein